MANKQFGSKRRRNELIPKGTNCAPPTYVGRVLSSARESSSQHTGTGVGLPGEGLVFYGVYLAAASALAFLVKLTS